VAVIVAVVVVAAAVVVAVVAAVVVEPKNANKIFIWQNQAKPK